MKLITPKFADMHVGSCFFCKLADRSRTQFRGVFGRSLNWGDTLIHYPWSFYEEES
jgi:hypothetical protein